MNRILFLVWACVFPCFLFACAQAPISLLNAEDRKLEADSRNGLPALSSALDDSHPWESHNVWQCFSNRQVAIQKTSVMFDEKEGWHDIPFFDVTVGKIGLSFDVPDEYRWNVAWTEAEWKALLDGSKRICFFAAYLQEIDESNSLWILSKVKTENGYWDTDEEILKKCIKADRSATDLREEEICPEADRQ